MAAAGARAGEATSPPDGAETRPIGAPYTIRHLGTRPAQRNTRVVAIAVGVLLLASGGVALATVVPLGGHAPGTRAAPSLTPARAPTRTPSAQGARAMPPMAPPAGRRGHGPAHGAMKVVGVGCPGDAGDTVTLDNAAKGPGWMPAGGGWTGNGCDGSALWTMDPNGHQPVPSTLTWRFSAAGASRCTLAVFVPRLNALGMSDYSVSVGPPGRSHVVAAMPVRQSAAAGQWLTLGTFGVSGPSVEITTAPMPGGPGPNHQGPGHHGAVAASAAAALCTR